MNGDVATVVAVRVQGWPETLFADGGKRPTGSQPFRAAKGAGCLRCAKGWTPDRPRKTFRPRLTSSCERDGGISAGMSRAVPARHRLPWWHAGSDATCRGPSGKRGALFRSSRVSQTCGGWRGFPQKFSTRGLLTTHQSPFQESLGALTDLTASRAFRAASCSQPGGLGGGIADG
jgi:hypothetical protein